MATYLQGVEDGRRDILIRIEREAVAVFRDLIADRDLGRSPLWVGETRAKLSAYVGLIKQLSPTPQAWQTIYERVEAEAIRQIAAENEEAKLASAKAVS